MLKVIGLCGLQQSGKSTVANYLVEHYAFTRIRFADSLKAMLREFGLTDEQLDGHLKETPDHQLLGGKTPRWAMQSLGSWGRERIAPDIWVNAWRRSAEQQRQAEHYCIVADDVRFYNEVAAILRLGGLIVKVTRPGYEQPVTDHNSEIYANRIAYDINLHNDGSLADLYGKIDRRLIRDFVAAGELMAS